MLFLYTQVSPFPSTNPCVYVSNNPNRNENASKSSCDGNRLAVSSSPWVVISNNNVLVSPFIHNVESDQGERWTSNSVHEGLVGLDLVTDNGYGGGESNVPSQFVSDLRKAMTFEEDLLCTFWQDDSHLNLLILNTLGHFGALEERDFEDVSIASGQLPERALQVCIPADLKAIKPPPKNRVSGLQFQHCFPSVVPESTGRDVSNIICEIWV
jgi:hypothetical protein